MWKSPKIRSELQNKEIVFSLNDHGLKFTTDSTKKIVELEFQQMNKETAFTLNIDSSSGVELLTLTSCMDTPQQLHTFSHYDKKVWVFSKTPLSFILECNDQVVFLHEWRGNDACESSVGWVKLTNDDTATISIVAASKYLKIIF